MERLTDERIAELEKLCGAATPGPWHVEEADLIPDTDDAEIGYEVVGPLLLSMEDGDYSAYQQCDAAHIAAFDPSTALRILDEIKRMRAVVDAAKEWKADMDSGAIHFPAMRRLLIAMDRYKKEDADAAE